MIIHRMPAYFIGPFVEICRYAIEAKYFVSNNEEKDGNKRQFYWFSQKENPLASFSAVFFFVFPLLLKVALLKVWNSKFKHTKMQKVSIHRNILDNIFIIRPKKRA